MAAAPSPLHSPLAHLACLLRASGLLGWAFLAWFPVAPKFLPLADGQRLFLLMQVPLLLFAAEGLFSVRKYIFDGGLFVCIVGSFGFHVDWISRLWINQQEWSMVQQVMGELPKNTKVQMDGSIEKWGKKAAVFEWVSNYQIEVIPLKREKGLFWRGPLCESSDACQQFLVDCTLQEFQIETFENYSDVDLQLVKTEIVIGLYQVLECQKTKD